MADPFTERWEEFRKLPNHPEMSVFPDRPARITHLEAIDSDYEFKCPKCKYSLKGITGTYCPECGTHLEYEPVTVFTAAEQSLVWAAALVMDRHEISNLIVTGSYDPFIGIFTGRGSMPHLMVPFKFFHEAANLLEESFGGRFFKRGERPAKSPEQPPWTCSACGEENPVTFEVCWKCNRERRRPAE